MSCEAGHSAEVVKDDMDLLNVYDYSFEQMSRILMCIIIFSFKALDITPIKLILNFKQKIRENQIFIENHNGILL